MEWRCHLGKTESLQSFKASIALNDVGWEGGEWPRGMMGRGIKSQHASQLFWKMTSWSYLFATPPFRESLSSFKIVGLPLYAKAVSALFFFLCLIRHDQKPINMKKHGNFHFPTRLKISYIINNLKDIYRIFWRMRVKNASWSLSQTIGVSEETSWVCPSCW